MVDHLPCFRVIILVFRLSKKPIGEGAVGQTEAIQRSRDGGSKWEMAKLPVEPNSPIWTFAVHPANPDRIVSCSHFGELYATEDAGDTWRKLPREFTEIRALSWVPN